MQRYFFHSSPIYSNLNNIVLNASALYALYRRILIHACGISFQIDFWVIYEFQFTHPSKSMGMKTYIYREWRNKTTNQTESWIEYKNEKKKHVHVICVWEKFCPTLIWMATSPNLFVERAVTFCYFFCFFSVVALHPFPLFAVKIREQIVRFFVSYTFVNFNSIIHTWCMATMYGNTIYWIFISLTFEIDNISNRSLI